MCVLNMCVLIRCILADVPVKVTIKDGKKPAEVMFTIPPILPVYSSEKNVLRLHQTHNYTLLIITQTR